MKHSPKHIAECQLRGLIPEERNESLQLGKLETRAAKSESNTFLQSCIKEKKEKIAKLLEKIEYFENIRDENNNS